MSQWLVGSNEFLVHDYICVFLRLWKYFRCLQLLRICRCVKLFCERSIWAESLNSFEFCLGQKIFCWKVVWLCFLLCLGEEDCCIVLGVVVWLCFPQQPHVARKLWVVFGTLPPWRWKDFCLVPGIELFFAIAVDKWLREICVRDGGLICRLAWLAIWFFTIKVTIICYQMSYSMHIVNSTTLLILKT